MLGYSCSMNDQPPFALFIRGPKAQIFDLADRLGFESEMNALAVSVFEDGPDSMHVQALYASRAEAEAALAGLNLAGLDITGVEHFITRLPDEDWVAKSQSGLPPVEAGRFFIYGAHDKDKIPMHCPYPILIEAGMAFGTGHHGTTKGCLLAFENLCAPKSRTKQIAHWPKTILDLGCGSGVLAIAAAKALNRNVLASDIDMDAIDVTRENARINQVGEHIEAVQLDGVPKDRGPFDLIFANILAPPLMAMADDIAHALAPAGVVILSGLLDEQADAMINRYEHTGLTLKRRASLAGWTTLVMRK